MKYNFYEGIVFSDSYENGISSGVFRIVETFCENELVYSVFVSTESGGERDETFIFDVSRRFDEAVRLCRYLCKMRVSAVHIADVLSDAAVEMLLM